MLFYLQRFCFLLVLKPVVIRCASSIHTNSLVLSNVPFEGVKGGMVGEFPDTEAWPKIINMLSCVSYAEHIFLLKSDIEVERAYKKKISIDCAEIGVRGSLHRRKSVLESVCVSHRRGLAKRMMERTANILKRICFANLLELRRCCCIFTIVYNAEINGLLKKLF